jgi:hypothetical protein
MEMEKAAENIYVFVDTFTDYIMVTPGTGVRAARRVARPTWSPA